MSVQMFRFNAGIVIASYLPLLMLLFVLGQQVAAPFPPAEPVNASLQAVEVEGATVEDLVADVFTVLDVEQITQGRGGSTLHPSDLLGGSPFAEKSKPYDTEARLSPLPF